MAAIVEKNKKKSLNADSNRCERIEFALNKFKNRKIAATVLGKSEDMLTAYAKGRTDPPFSIVVALSKETQTDLQWLADGHGVSTLFPADVKINEERIVQIIKAVNKALLEMKRQLSDETLGRIYVHLYNHNLPIDNESIVSLIRIIC